MDIKKARKKAYIPSFGMDALVLRISNKEEDARYADA